MRSTTRQAGFTLIEVLVALAIIAVAMAAAVRLSGVMTQSNGLLRDRGIALLAVNSRMAELRLEGVLPLGVRNVPCDQGRLALRCEQSINATPGERVLTVGIRAFDRAHEGPALAQLQTLLNRPAPATAP
jgi:general secretion pathway protein I